MIRSHGPPTVFAVLAAFLIGCAEEPAKQAADSIAAEPAQQEASVPAEKRRDRPSDACRRSWSVLAMMCFLPGVVTGFLLGSIVDLGVAPAIHKVMVAPIRAVIFFAGVSVCCYLCTWLWRLPRRYLVGRYHATAIAALFSGAFLGCGFYLTVEWLESAGPLRAIGAPSEVQYCGVIGIGILFAVAAVEVEAVLSRLTSGSDQHAPTANISQTGDR